MRIVTHAAAAACLTLAVAAGPASATDNGFDYNNSFATADISDCVYPKQPTGLASFAFDGSYIPFKQDYLNANGPWPGCEHAPGSIRVLKLQSLTVGGRATYMTRGGTATVPNSPARPHVHIAASDLKRTLALVPHIDRKGNGRAAPGCSFPIYARPTALPDAMKYRPGEPDSSGASWSNYGNPGARFGANYSDVLWNLPRRDVNGQEAELSGAGILAATIKPRQRLLVCDVSHQVLDSFDANGSTVNGYTEWVYCAVQNGSETIYGWVMAGASYKGTGYQLFDWT